MRDCKKAEVVTEKPYFKIKIGCSNRAFYDEKNHLYQIAEKVDIEIQDGYITEKCDYEGDLEEIVIYRQERAEPFVQAVIASYGIDRDELPTGANVHVSIF